MAAKLLLALVAVLSAVIVNHIAKIISAAGVLKHVYNHVPGTCRLVPGVEQGSEDIALTSSGLAFISSGLLPPGFILDPVYYTFEQKMLVFDFKNPAEGAKEIKIVLASGEDFMPHGLSVYEDDSGEVRLFVVNHGKGHRDSVEIFRFDAASNSLHHLKSVKHPLLYSLNDVVATGPETFYATNDKYTTGLYSRMAETWLLLPWSNVVYYSDGEAAIVADGLMYANGINISPDGRFVYVANPTTGVVIVYHRQDDNTLTFSHDITLHTGVDNIYVDATTGDLWVGAHQKPIQFSVHMQNASYPCGSQVLRIQDPATENPRVTEMYSDDGQAGLWGSSAACYLNKQLLIGTVNHRLMHCTVDVPL
ncbi:PREDICTED: serum paraoxonase/arylesterase 1-like [Branchiostoma belcheri]|uniref:Paraoxonase n=1 Tax=Branchiostoma belcheri TaxID=7741 RepID=A0A6P4YZN3_BRABE|nr:PREDICTED: serum paraoxonase/arylesterase 1-like [Branchiostoma belcheri]